MLNSNHPDDERLSALASHDPEATADDALTSHVTSCTRCMDLVTEIGALRASLAELPDLAPSRPLQLLPPVTELSPIPADGIGVWMRRLFAPLLTAGAALAMVGLVGTASPAFESGGTDAGADGQGEQAQPAAQEADRLMEESAAPGRVFSASDAPEGDRDRASNLDNSAERFEEGTHQPSDEEAFDGGSESLPAERSPWPMVLFTGVALIVGAALLRWILVPRAG